MRPSSGLTATLAAVGITIALTSGSVAAAGVSDASTRATSTKPGAAASCPLDPNAQKSELRATWVATVANIDWPSKPGLTADQQKAELMGWLDLAVAQKHNAVFLQVRPTADAFWRGALEPWSKFLTGTAGADPGYDPLGFAVTAAHNRNLELHAWFNPYRISMDEDLSKLAPNHPARQHPDWVVPYGGKLYYNPGVPAARKFSEDAIMDAVTKYDIDGVHFDDYFYPYPVAGQAFPDDAQFAAYGSGFPSRADWRRDNINKLIVELGSRIKAAKPEVKFGVSPFAVWRNKATDAAGSDTTAGAQTYDDLYADTRRWVQEGWVDYIAPQIYWSQGFAPADYEKLVPWWSDLVRGTDVHLYIGQATYKIGTSTQSPGWSNPQEMSNHLTFNTAFPEVKGNIFFSIKDVRADRLGATTLLNQQSYAHPALVPAMTWLDNRAPKSPKTLHERVTSSGVRVTWRAVDRTTSSYAVYRLPAATGRVRAGDCRIADATHLVATMRATGRTEVWIDPSAEPGQSYTYVVTGLDRTWNESAPVQVTTRR